MKVPDDIVQILARDPGDEYFIAYADELKTEGNLAQAERVCLAGLSARPTAHSGRILLARIYYELGFLPFAVRELKEISQAMPQIESLRELIKRFEPDTAAIPQHVATVETVAETEFDIDEIELVDD